MSKRTEAGIAFMSNPFVAGIAGAAIGFFICWFTMVQPMFVHLNQREKSLHEWERINRQEREAIATIKTIGTEELRKWVSTLDEQNTRYAELQTLLHKQELDLVGPATTHLWIVLIAVLGVGGFVAWMMRDSNADAARTLHNAVAILPSLREALNDRSVALDAPGDSSPQLETKHVPTNIDLISNRKTGKIKRFIQEKSYGFIMPDDGDEEIFFHEENVKLSESQKISEGYSASYRLSKDSQGRVYAEDIVLIAKEV